jgi:hypothetical protein
MLKILRLDIPQVSSVRVLTYGAIVLAINGRGILAKRWERVKQKFLDAGITLWA